MNRLSHSIELKVKPRAAKPLLLDEYPDQQASLCKVALNGWKMIDVNLWRHHYVTAVLLRVDSKSEATIVVPSLEAMKAAVSSFYARAA